MCNINTRYAVRGSGGEVYTNAENISHSRRINDDTPAGTDEGVILLICSLYHSFFTELNSIEKPVSTK